MELIFLRISIWYFFKMNIYSISELHFVTRHQWSQGCLKISVLQATFIYARHPPDNQW